MTRHATIISTGAYLPEIERSNTSMRERFGVVIDKFEASSGIKTRFYAPDDWATSDLAVEAGKKALAKAGLRPEDLDLIILGTDSPDYITPATSVVAQYKLGAKNAGTFDVGCACASFPTGLNLAAGLIESNPNLKYVLVIGAYMMHKLTDWENDVMSFFYGDGAGAAILTFAARPDRVPDLRHRDDAAAVPAAARHPGVRRRHAAHRAPRRAPRPRAGAGARGGGGPRPRARGRRSSQPPCSRPARRSRCRTTPSTRRTGTAAPGGWPEDASCMRGGRGDALVGGARRPPDRRDGAPGHRQVGGHRQRHGAPCRDAPRPRGARRVVVRGRLQLRRRKPAPGPQPFPGGGRAAAVRGAPP